LLVKHLVIQVSGDAVVVFERTLPSLPSNGGITFFSLAESFDLDMKKRKVTELLVNVTIGGKL